MSATISIRQTRPSRPSARPRAHGPLHPPAGVRTSASAGVARPVSRVSDATYRRRRAVVGTALAALVAVGAVTTYDVLAGSGSVPASAAVSQPARSTTVAQPGDSLWSIAERHHGDVSLVRYVDKLVALNGGATIQAGQLVTLP